MKFCWVWVSVIFMAQSAAASYDGINLLAILGQSTSSQSYKDFKSYWVLDKDGQNPALGIKVYINPISDKIESIIITGTNTDLGGLNFKKCTARLPFNINLNDDTLTLVKKLGRGEKLIGRNTLKFYNHNTVIEASYTDLRAGEISFLKFSSNDSHKVAAAKPTTYTPAVNSPATIPVNKETGIDKHTVAEKPVTASTGAQPKAKAKDAVPMTPFKKAILDVFKASKESSFDNIKTDTRKEGNFWKYKYTYNTQLKIPGEKYNMLYSFPFITSQLDFVVVLKESDSYEKSFDNLYHDFEKQLTTNFPASEGWISSCLPGKDKTQLPDLAFRNDKYGAVILDHSQNPQGRHILYLRFLLFAD
jgi:hypothetical protein